MSRDWTPFTHHQIDKDVTRLSERGIKFVNSNGEKFVLYDPESPFSKRCPNLSFLLGENECKALLERSKCMETVLDSVEVKLDLIIKTRDTVGPVDTSWYDKDPDALFLLTDKWYTGNLDPGFYYNTLNHGRFIEGLTDYARELEKVFPETGVKPEL